MKFIFLWITCSFALAAHADYDGRIITDMGTIGIRIHTDDVSVNFAQLAKGKKKFFDLDGKKVQRPFYEGQIFHRVHPDLGIFSGCPLGNGRGWPGFMIPTGDLKNTKFDRSGLIAMAKIPGDDRVGSQFFITTKENHRLDGRYPIIGTVTSGMDVVQKIAKADRDITMKPKKAIHVKQIEIDGI